MMHEKIDELLRERICGSGLGGIEDVLLLQALTGLQGGQGLDINTLLPVLLLAGGGIGRGRSERIALVALIAAMQAQQAQTGGTISGGTQPTSNNLLTLLVALGLIGEDRGFYLPRRVFKPEHEEEPTKHGGEGEEEEEREKEGGSRRQKRS